MNGYVPPSRSTAARRTATPDARLRDVRPRARTRGRRDGVETHRTLPETSAPRASTDARRGRGDDDDARFDVLKITQIATNRPRFTETALATVGEPAAREDPREDASIASRWKTSSRTRARTRSVRSNRSMLIGPQWRSQGPRWMRGLVRVGRAKRVKAQDRRLRI